SRVLTWSGSGANKFHTFCRIPNRTNHGVTRFLTPGGDCRSVSITTTRMIAAMNMLMAYNRNRENDMAATSLRKRTSSTAQLTSVDHAAKNGAKPDSRVNSALQTTP